MKNPNFNDKQLQQVAGSIFDYLKESGMSSRDFVRIVTMLTSQITDDLSGDEHRYEMSA